MSNRASPLPYLRRPYTPRGPHDRRFLTLTMATQIGKTSRVRGGGRMDKD